MKEELKNKISGIKSTVKDAFNKQSDKDIGKDESKTDFSKQKNADREKGLGSSGQKKVS